MAESVRTVAATFKLVVDEKGFAKADSGIERIKTAAEKVAGKDGLSKVSEAVKKAGHASKEGFGIIRDGLSGLLGKFGLGEVAEGVEELAHGLSSVGSVAVGFTAGIGALAAGLAMVGDKTAKHAVEMDNAALRANMNVVAFQELLHGAEATGTGIETVNSALGKLGRSMYEVGLGNAETTKSFRSLGIEVKGADGKLRPTQDVLYDLADKMKAMPEGAERGALAMKVLGRGGLEAVPWLSRGSDALRHFAKGAHEAGVIVSKDTVKMARAYGLAKHEIAETLEGFELRLGTAVMPELLKMAKGLEHFLASKRAVIMDSLISGLDKALSLFGAIGDIVGMISKGWNALPEVVKAALVPITKMLDVLEEIEDYKEYLAGRFSARGAEEAKARGPEALDKYIREKGFGAKGDAEGIQTRGGRAGMQKYLGQREEDGGVGGFLDKIGRLAAGEAPNINTNAQQGRMDSWLKSFQIANGRGPTEQELGAFYTSDERRSRTNLAERDELAPLNASGPSGGGWYSPQAPYLPPNFTPGGQSQGPVPVTGEVKIKIEVGEGLQSVNDTQAQIRSANASF